jgi:hypothetical protein
VGSWPSVDQPAEAGPEQATVARLTPIDCQEPGVARFDVMQNVEDPTKFVLVEVLSACGLSACVSATARANGRGGVETMVLW